MSRLFKRIMLSTSTVSRTKSSLSSPQIGYFGVLNDKNSSFMRGPALAPDIIRKELACDSRNSYCERQVNISNIITDYGNISIGDSDDVYSLVQKKIDEVIRAKKFPMILGGDHSISFPVVRSLHKATGKSLKIIHFDAHPDIYPLFQNNPLSHASPFARILEEGQLCSGLVAVGIRTCSPEQAQNYRRFSKEIEILVVEAKDYPVRATEFRELVQKVVKDTDDVYISLDMDVLEPGLAPGVSHREAGGLSVRQLIDAIHAIPGRVIGADLVEFNPLRDIDGLTGAVASKLMKELVSKIYHSTLVD